MRSTDKPLPDIHRIQFPNDVKFEFSPSNLVLWGNVASLSNASPYFKLLFDSGFAESSSASSKAPPKKSRRKEVEKDFDDSDDETDEFVVARNAKDSPVNLASQVDLPFHLLEIDAAAYSTYHAVLCWLHTGHISFAPLRSTFRLQPDPVSLRNAKFVKLQTISSHPLPAFPKSVFRLAHFPELSDPVALRNAKLIQLQTNQSLPLPASPKSVYRLAHFLKLPDLAKLALANIRSQLTKENIAYEVMGDVALAYEEVGAMELDFAVPEWAFVKASAAMKDVERLAEKGEMPSVGLMSFKLCKRL